MIKYDFPKIVTPNDCISLLSEFDNIFDLGNQMVPNVIMDLSRVKKISLLGILINYKIIEYTYKNYCFEKAELSVNDYIREQWEKYGFTELLNSFISNRDITQNKYKKLKIKFEDSFFIAPQALLRSTDFSKESLKTNFLPKIEEYYDDDEDIVAMIFLCLSEILLNFWEHAIDDTNSILVAEGNRSHIEIGCADTGRGIITTLGDVLGDNVKTDVDIIQKSVERDVTSKKKSNHMGYGLWVLNQITKKTGGRLHIYSEGTFFKNEQYH